MVCSLLLIETTHAMLKGLNNYYNYWFMVLFSYESVTVIMFWDALWRFINTHGMLLSYLSFSLNASIIIPNLINVTGQNYS